MSIERSNWPESRSSVVALVGLPGCGKTTAGRLLAQRKNFHFADTDDWIERSENRTISDIFKSDGEDYFRRLERDVLSCLSGEPTSESIARVIKEDLQELTHLCGLVLSTGGGFFIPFDNRRLLKELSITVYLRCTAETIAQRLSKDRSRPLLQGDSEINPQTLMVEKLEGLLSVRQAAYELADITVDTTRLTTDSMVDNIEDALIARNQL